MNQSRVMPNDCETVDIEKMHGGLLEKARKHAADCSETFWDMFYAKQTESRKFFLSLPREQREFLQYMATVEALLGGD